MRFKISLLLLAFSLSSCGALGQKDKPITDSSVGGNGCLDNSKDLVGRYVEGKIEQAEWKGAFDCINQSLDFFTQYVRGSASNAYTQADMRTLIQRFLITNRTVNPELLKGAFNLKEALFGGDASKFTNGEIDLLKNALSRLRDITGALIPYLKLKQDPNATFDELIEMTKAFQDAGKELAKYIKTLPRNDMSEKALTVLIEQLSETFNLTIIDGLDRKIFLAKWLLFNTRRDAFEASDWEKVFNTAMGFGGLILAYTTAEDLRNPDHKPMMTRFMEDYRYRDFIYNLAMQAKPTIEEALTSHEGNTPLPLFDYLIDELPNTFLNGLPKVEIKKALRPLVRILLMSKTKSGVDQAVINTIYGILESLVKDMGQIDRLYEKAGFDRFDVSPEQLKAAFAQYQGSVPSTDQARFAEVKKNVLNYPPLLYGDKVNQVDTNSIKYAVSGVGYTLSQHKIVLMFNVFIKHLLRTYGTGDGYFNLSDFQHIFSDSAGRDPENFQHVLNAMGLVDETIPAYGKKRFQDIDLFTPVSNGDEKVTLEEVTHFALMIISSATLTTKMYEKLSGHDGIPGICDQGLGPDLMGWTQVPIECFRKEFFDKLPEWLTYFPRLNQYWNNLSDEQKKKAAIWLEHGARREGYGEKTGDMVGKFDYGASAAVLHYTETIFTRFDSNSTNEIISKAELNNAFPVFKSLLAKKDKLKLVKNSDYILQGIFTYIAKYKEMPEISLTEPKAIGKLAWWIITYKLPTTKLDSDRSTVFNIVCQLSAPERFTVGMEAELDALNKRVCAP